MKTGSPFIAVMLYGQTHFIFISSTDRHESQYTSEATSLHLRDLSS